MHSLTLSNLEQKLFARSLNLRDTEIRQTIPFLYWTGLDFIWDQAAGNTVECSYNWENTIYAEYISKISNWEYSLEEIHLNNSVLDKYFDPSKLREHNLALKEGGKKLRGIVIIMVLYLKSL